MILYYICSRKAWRHILFDIKCNKYNTYGNMENKKSLTKAELNVMNILWSKNEATVNEIIEVMSEPKPAYTTVLTVMQVLTRKGIVSPERRGKAHVFRPLLSREEYIDTFMEETRNVLFQGSLRSLFSYFVKSEKLSKEELNKILDEINDEE
mgnify:FL=1